MQEILNSVKETLTKTSPDYDIIIHRLHIYYDMRVESFRIHRKRNLTIQFPIFVQPYMQQPLILYQLKTAPVPIVDKSTKADSYSQLQIKKLCLALNTETYINIRQQQSATCKRIGFEFFCKERFVVRHTSIHICESAIYFDLDQAIMKQNCNFKFYYNKTDVPLTVLDGGNKII